MVINFYPSGRRPSWITKRVNISRQYSQICHLLKKSKLHTVCESASCPNIYECFSRRHLTFLILGNVCTRNCRFCGVSKGKPEPPDPEESEKIASFVASLQLPYVVITSVTRDDLPDGGAYHFKEVTDAIKKISPSTRVELLLPDFQGNHKSLEVLFQADADIIGHNIETVPELYPEVRPKASYQVSLNVIRKIKRAGFPVKSSLMLGLGETSSQVQSVLKELRQAGCDFLVLGQYLQPDPGCLPVREYISPQRFAEYEELARKTGFTKIFSGPFFRSSYHAWEFQPTC